MPSSGAEETPQSADGIPPCITQDVIILPTKLSDSDVALVGNRDVPATPLTPSTPSVAANAIPDNMATSPLPDLPSPALVNATEIAQTTPSVTGAGGKGLAITSMLAHPNSPETTEAPSNAHVDPTAPSISSNISPESTEERADDDVVMGDASLPPHRPQIDEDLPPWLASIIQYLRGVAEDVAWQDLVTAFVKFEKRGPPNGVSFPSGSIKS
jgi:hypothetical protein